MDRFRMRGSPFFCFLFKTFLNSFIFLFVIQSALFGLEDVLVQEGSWVQVDDSHYQVSGNTHVTGSFQIEEGEQIYIEGSDQAQLLWTDLSGVSSVLSGQLYLSDVVFSLINQAGIEVSASGAILAENAAVILSALDIRPEDFFNQNYAFFDHSSEVGSVSNLGFIQVDDFVALIGEMIDNEGVIVANLGEVAWGAGHKVVLTMDNDGLIGVLADADTEFAIEEQRNERAQIVNTGRVQANGGKVLISASAAQNLYSEAIRHTGQIEAASLENAGGQIRLTAKGGVIALADNALLSVSAAEERSARGFVDIDSDQAIYISGQAVVEGNALNGGDGAYIVLDGHGQKLGSSAEESDGVIITGQARVEARGAEQHSKAGRIFINSYHDIQNPDQSNPGSQGRVGYLGDSARLDASGGDAVEGGWIDFSGRYIQWHTNGPSFLTANQMGQGGRLTFDPDNITISTGADTNTTGFTAGADETEAFGDDASVNSVFDVTPGTGSFHGVTGATITLQAAQTITLSSDWDVDASVDNDGSDNDDINIVLQAGEDIVIEAELSTGGGAGDITLQAEDDITFGVSGALVASGGTISITANDNTLGQGGASDDGLITMDAAATIQGDGEIYLTAKDTITIGSVTANNNNIFISSTADAVYDHFNEAVDVDAGSGTFTLTAFNGATLDTSVGSLVVLAGSGGVIDIDEADGISIDDVDLSSGSNYIDVFSMGAMLVNGVIVMGDSSQLALSTDSGQDMTFEHNSVDIGNSTLALNSGGSILAANASGTAEVVVDGNVLIEYAGTVGSDTHAFEITGDGSGDSTFTIQSLDGATELDVNVLTDQFSTLSFNELRGNMTADISFPGTDVVDIDDDGTVIINNVNVSQLDMGFAYVVDATKNLEINSFVSGTKIVGFATMDGSLTVVADAGGMSAVGSDSSFFILYALGGENGDLIINEDITVNNSNQILLAANDDIVFASGATFTHLATTDGTTVEIGANYTLEDSFPSGDGVITMADGATIDAGDQDVEMLAAGDITIGRVLTTSASVSAITLTSTIGGIVDGGDTGGDDLVANSGRIVMDVVTGVGNGNALETSADSFDIDSTGDGNIQLSESDGASFFELDLDGTGNVDIVSLGTTTIEATGGTFDVADGELSISSGGMNNTLNINNAVSASSNLSLEAGTISHSADGDLTAQGNVTLTATHGDYTMTDGVLIDADAGDVSLTASGDVTLGGIVTVNTVSVISNNGSIIDGGDTDTDIEASIVSLLADLDIGTVGSELDLAAQVASVSVTGTDNRAVALRQIDGAGDLDFIAITMNNGVFQVDVENGTLSFADVLVTDFSFGQTDVTIQASSDIDVAKVFSTDGTSIEMTSTGGSITFNEGGAYQTATNGGNLTLVAQTNVNLNAQDYILDGGTLDITSVTGNVALAAGVVMDTGGGDLLVSADGSIILFDVATNGGSIDLSSTGAAGSISFSAGLTAIATNTGSGDITATAVGNVSKSSGHSFVTEGGNVSFTSTGGAASLLDTDAGGGEVLTTGGSVTINSLNTSILSAAIQTEIGDVQVTVSGAGQDIQLLEDIVTTAGSVTLSAANSLIFGTQGAQDGNVITGTGNIVFAVNELDLAQTVSSTSGFIRINPNTPGNSTGLEDAAADLVLTNEDLANLSTSNELILGDGSGEVSVAADEAVDISAGLYGLRLNGTNVSLAGSVTLGANELNVNAAGTVQVDGLISSGSGDVQISGTLINLDANVIATDIADITLDGPSVLSAVQIQSVGGTITFEDTVTLDTEAVTVSSGDGDIVFNNTVDGAVLLGLNSGTGNIVFEEAIGGGTPLSELVIFDGQNIDFNQNVTVGRLDQAAGTGTTAFQEDVFSTNGVSLANTGIFFNGLTMSSTNSELEFLGNVTLSTDSVVLNTGVGDGDITFGGLVDGAENLTLTAGAGNIAFNDAVGSVESLGDILIVSGHDFSNLGNIDANSFVQTAGTGLTAIGLNLTVEGDINITTDSVDFQGATLVSNTGNVDVTATLIELDAASVTAIAGDIAFHGPVLTSTTAIDIAAPAGSVSFEDTLNGGQDLSISALTEISFDAAVGGTSRLGELSLTLGDGGLATFASTLNVAAISNTLASGTIVFEDDVDSTGDITLNANVVLDEISITTNAGHVEFGGTVQLNTGASSISTGVGNGDITFNQTVQADVAASRDLELTAGTGSITFLGELDDLADVTIQSAFNVAVNETVLVNRFTQNSGSNQTLLSADITAANGISLTTGTFSLQAIQLVTTNSTIELDGAVDLGAGTISVDTGAGGGDFHVTGRVDGDGDLSLSVGAGDVLFDDNLGAFSGVGSIQVNSADDVTFSGTAFIESYDQLAGTGLTTFAGFSDMNEFSFVGNELTIDALFFVDLEGSPMTIDNAGLLTIGTNADLHPSGAFDQVGVGAVSLGGAIFTNQDDVSFASDVTLIGHSQVQANAGGVTFQGSVNGAFNLTANGGDEGNVFFLGGIGDLVPIQTLTIDHGNAAAFLGDVVADAVSINVSGAFDFLNGITTLGSPGLSIVAGGAGRFVEGVTATNGLINIEMGGDLLSNGEILADNSIVLRSADLTLQEDVRSTNSSVLLSSLGNMVLNGNVLNDSRLVTLNSSGSITLDENKLIQAGNLSVSTREDAHLYTEIAILDATVLGAGDLTVEDQSGLYARYISMSDGDLTILARTNVDVGVIQGAGNLSIVTDGDIARNGGVISFPSGDVQLLTGAKRSVGRLHQPVEIYADTVSLISGETDLLVANIYGPSLTLSQFFFDQESLVGLLLLNGLYFGNSAVSLNLSPELFVGASNHNAFTMIDSYENDDDLLVASSEVYFASEDFIYLPQNTTIKVSPFQAKYDDLRLWKNSAPVMSSLS